MKLEMGHEFTKEQRERQMRLERLYVLDGRHLKTLADGSPNPLHGLYTGLADKAEELEAELNDSVCDI